MTDRFSYKGNRRIICGLVLLISVFGAAMVFSASKGFGDNLELETSEHMFVETVSMVFGMAAAIACSYVTLDKWKRITPYPVLAAAASWILLFTPLRSDRFSSRMYISFGIVYIRPVTLMIFAYIMWLGFIVTRLEQTASKKLVFLSIWGSWFATACMMGITKYCAVDIGRILIITFVISMFFVGYIGRHMIGFAIAVISGIVCFLLILLSAGDGYYKVRRITSWLNPSAYEMSDGYFILQNLSVIKNAGFLGNGWCNVNENAYMASPRSDDIFCVVVDNFGWLGGFVLVVVCAFLSYQIFRLVREVFRKKCTFGAAVSLGIFIHFTFSWLGNTAACLNLIPWHASCLPFVSLSPYIMIGMFLEFGVLISVSRYCEKTGTVKEEEIKQKYSAEVTGQ